MNKTVLLKLLVLSVFLTSCSPIISTLAGKKYTPVSPQDKVLLLTSSDPLPSNSEFLGSVSVTDSGLSINCGYQTVVNKAKDEARKIGGNIIKLSKHKKPNFFGSVCHQVKAMIYRVDDINNLKFEENHKNNNQEKYPDTFETEKGVIMSVNMGYAYRTSKAPDNMSPLLKDYIQGLKSGYNLGTNLTYFYTNTSGFGIQYNMFKVSNHLSNIIITDINGNSTTGTLEDNVTFNFIGPSFSSRIFVGTKANLFNIRVALGYLSYIDNAITPIESFKLTGSTFGSAFDLGYDMNIANNLFIGLQVSTVGGIIQTFTKHDLNNHKEIIN